MTQTGSHLPPELVEQMGKGRVALFLGADLPQTVTGLPSRADLARGLAHRHGLDESLSLAEVAQRVSQAGNRWAFTDFIRNALDTAGKETQPFHRRIVEWVQEHKVETLITTAYDNLLELAFQQAGVALNRVVRGGDVSFINPDRPTLIKLYGDAGQPDTLVVTDRDHSDLLRDRGREPLIDEVRRAMRLNTVLFIGYNLADPDFRFLFDQVAESRFARTAYAVWPGLPEADVHMWRDRGIVILEADPFGMVTAMAAPAGTVGGSQAITPVLSSGGGTDMVYERHPPAAVPDPSRQADLEQLIRDAYSVIRECERNIQTGRPEEKLQARRTIQAQWDDIEKNLGEYRRLVGNNLPADIAQIAAHFGLVVTPPAQHIAQPAKGSGAAAGSPGAILNSGKAWAVLVGINVYQDPYINPLAVCVDDVTAIHQTLAAHYQVSKLLTDATPDHLPTRANILGELASLAQNAGEGDLLLFYFSGHGMAEGGESYLLARDTRLSALKHTAVAMRDVRELIEASPARAKVIVLDACHSGAQIGKAAAMMTPEFIRRVFEEAQGIAVLASCTQGQQSWEWKAKNRSVFTWYLLEALAGQADFDQKGFVTVADASRYVTDGVKAWAAQEGVPQTPTLNYTVAGDIVLCKYKA